MLDISVLLVIATILLVIIFTLKYYLKTNNTSNENSPDKSPAATNRPRDTGSRRAQLVRNRGLRIRETANTQQGAEINEEGNDRHTTINEIEFPDGKIGAKKRAKLEAKAEKKAAREAEEQQRAERKHKLELEEAERKKLEEKEQAEAKAREEEEKKAKEEKEKKEYEEYLKMKEAFSIDEEGFEEGDDDSSQNLLQDFVNYIKENKVVIIEDLAAHFKLKTQACIDRIKDLQQEYILTGVIDDRGKFIYISESEIENVAKFIRQRGRVSIAELAEHSNELISLVSVK